MLTALAVLLVLILVNGLFALSEIAIVSSSRVRLQQLASRGRTGAAQALALAAEPTRFLSSVQVGITAIGILSGAIARESIAVGIRSALEGMPPLAAHADSLSVGIMVIALTLVSLILGELVPKRLALANPEAVAAAIARPMTLVASIGRPIVHLLSATTDALVRVTGIRQTPQPAVTADEIRIMLEQGAREGVFEPIEHRLMSNVLDLDERLVGSALTPRADITFLDVREGRDVHRARLRAHHHNVLPLCDGGMDHVLGFVRAARVLDRMLEDPSADLVSLAEPALFVPETMTLMTLLEQFRRTHLPVALVVDEFGGVEGLVSLTDVMSAIVGDLPDEPGEQPLVVVRDDGTWLMDGRVSIDALVDTLGDPGIASPRDRARCHTLGGLVMLALGRVPRVGDTFVRGFHRFEVVDMDRHRIDRVLIGPVERPPDASAVSE
ncbi:MAG: hemolysin family protein [Vicinamibacterales bacterium]